MINFLPKAKAIKPNKIKNKRTNLDDTIHDSVGDPVHVPLILAGDGGELQDQRPRVAIELEHEAIVEPRDLGGPDGTPPPHIPHHRVEAIAEPWPAL